MCFSVEWFAHLLVMLVLIGAAVMIARILIPYVIGWMGAGATVIMFGLSFPHNR